MATKILVRRGVVADLDQETLDEGELAFTTDELGLYVGSNAVGQGGYVKVNKTGNIEYDGNALTSATDTNNLKEAVQNIDVALKTEQDNVDTLQSDLDALESNVTSLSNSYNEHAHGNIDRAGKMNNAAVAPGTGDSLVFTDSSDEDKVTRGIAIDAEGTSYLKEDGTWHTPAVEDLDNISLTDITNGQVLKYSDGSWVNSSDILDNIVLTDIANGQVLKYSDGNWVNSGDIDENTKYTFGIDGTTWSAPGGAVYSGEAITLEASTGDQDDATIKFIKGSSRMVISNPASGVVVLNSLPRPFTVNENDALGVDEEITLTQGHNIIITEDGGAIEIKTSDDLTLNKVDDLLGSSSHSIIFKNKWFQGGNWVDGDNELYVSEQRKLMFQPASDSAKVVLTTDSLIDELFNKENTFTGDQRIQGDVTIGAKAAAGYDPSYKLRFEHSTAANPSYIDMYVDNEGVLVTDDGTNISAVGGFFPSITTQSGTEIVNGTTYDSALINFKIGSATASVELIEGNNTNITNVSTGKIAINSRIRPVKVNGTQILDANSLDTEDLDLTAGDNITITEADGVVTFDVADITTATQNALNLKASLASPYLTGSPTTTTPTTSDGIANKGYVDTAINNAVFGDVAVEWVLEASYFTDTPNHTGGLSTDLTFDWDTHDYKVVFDFETVGEDNDFPHMYVNNETSSSGTRFNFMYRATNGETGTQSITTQSKTFRLELGGGLPTGNVNSSASAIKGELIISKGLYSFDFSGTDFNNFSIEGYTVATPMAAPTNTTFYVQESRFIGNYSGQATINQLNFYSNLLAGSLDFSKLRIYKRAK